MAMTEPWAVRRVVTGHDARGLPVFVSDGPPPVSVTSRSGHGLAEVWWFDGPPRTVDDGGDPPAAARGSFPSGGAIAARVIRFPGVPDGTPEDERWLRVRGDDPAVPGMHRTDTLDLMVVLEGRIVLGLDDGERELGPGDAVVQRGTAHRWRVAGPEPCVFLSVLLSPGAADGPRSPLVPRTDGRAGAGPRRVVTGTAGDGTGGGTSAAVCDGPPPAGVRAPGPHGSALYDLWQTGGPLTACDQGGDRADGWALGPLGDGVAFVHVTLPPGHDPGDAGVHTTRTVDVGVVVSGALELALPGEKGMADAVSTVLRRGDVVVQRGTAHRWRPVGEEPAVLVSVMAGVPEGGRR